MPIKNQLKKNLQPLMQWAQKPRDLWHRKQGHLPAYYFAGCPNVGDLLTHYLLRQLYPQITERHPPVQVYSHRLPHLMGVGSILRLANEHSWVWGSGIIGEGYWPERLDPKKILALRGPITRQRLAQHLQIQLTPQLPLGDPGILLPRVYQPAIKKKYRLGYIPHYVDQHLLNTLVPQDPEVCIIRVQQAPETFISQLLACETLASSSLHGLILADAYGIPNCWLKFSDKIIGGHFKFLDYYATTDQPQQTPQQIQTWQDIKPLHTNPARYTSVKHYLGDHQQLISALQPALQHLTAAPA